MNTLSSSLKQISAFGIVSPCSTCKNQLALADPIKGLPACPRRAAQATKAALQAANIDTSQYDPLALTGNEDNNSGSTGLINPVYSTQLNSILVWVATLKDNPAIYDDKGNVINPDLLDPSFDTKYIQCKDKPVTPQDNESQYRIKGAWNESDQLNINFAGNQQTIPGTDSNTIVLLDGFANKVNFAYSSPRTSADRDYSVSGT